MRKEKIRMLIAHLLLAVLIGVVCLAPKAKALLKGPLPLIIGIAVIELLFIIMAMRSHKKTGALGTGPTDIITFVWILMIIWEICTSVMDLAHPVLVPAPENVFYTFVDQWKVMLLNISYSLRLLIGGMALGLGAAVILGLVFGWNERLKAFSYPIANVMAPIPAIVISPYLVAIMPTFRSASLVVVILGVFWPQFLGIINRIASVEPEILDSAKIMKLSQPVMLFRILLPYLVPGILNSLKVTMTTSVLMLNFAELMGATHGMGYYIQNSIVYANYTHAVAGIIVIGVVVTILGSIVGIIQRKFIKWH
ncbi:MAG: ABC transporter permease subunit [Clostridiales bacterium]|nr:ABC transporter permease subunit [Clostridiales bacterium]